MTKGILILGVHGWYPLLPTDSSLAAPVLGSAPNLPHLPLVTCAYVGAVEVSAGFTSTRDRELLLYSARKCGWEAPCLQSVISTKQGEDGRWEVDVRVVGLWAQMKVRSRMLANPPPLAFIRYRFFDLGWLAIPLSLSSLSSVLILCVCVCVYMCVCVCQLIEPVASPPVYMTQSDCVSGDGGEGLCYYQLQHKAHILIPSSKRLEW